MQGSRIWVVMLLNGAIGWKMKSWALKTSMEFGAVVLSGHPPDSLKPKKFMSAEFQSPRFRNVVLVKTEIPIHQNTNWISKSRTFQQISAELGEKVKSHLNYDHRYKKEWARRTDRNPKMRNLLTQKKLGKKKKHN